MTNDITTLNGSLMELGQLMKTKLEGRGVYPEINDGLTTLANRILDVNKEIRLTTDKTIIDNSINESTTITADFEDVVTGKTVKLYNNKTKAFIANMTDNGDGTYTYTYNSTGVGDIEFYAIGNGIKSNTILIEDCLKVGISNWTGTYNTGTDTYDYIVQRSGTGSSKMTSNVKFPRAFEITYKFKDNNSSANTSGNGLWFISGTKTATTGTVIGTTSTSQRIRVYNRNSGTDTSVQYQGSAYTLQTWTDARIYCDGTNISISVGGKTASGTLNSNANSLYMILDSTGYTNYRIAEFKIKPYSA